MNNKTNKLIKISLLLAIAFVINYLESLFPLPLPLPGVKLGLANCIGLIVLFLYDEKDFIAFTLLKVLLVALMRTGFGVSFFISLSGSLLAMIISLIIYKFTKASIFGISVGGALFHALGQVLMVMIIYDSIYMINYLAFLEIASVISGVLTAFIAVSVLRRLPNKMIKE